MNGITNLKNYLGSINPAYRYGAVILATVAACGWVYYLNTIDAFQDHKRFTNSWAAGLSLMSAASLACIYWFAKRWIPPAAPMPDAPSLAPPPNVRLIGFILAGLWIAVALPATFRAVNHPREVQVFWHDEAITLEQAQAFIDDVNPIPTYRFTQGWITYLPVVLPLKALNGIVPVPIVLTNVIFRLYQLTMLFFIVYCTYRLIWQISGSVFLASAVVLISYSRHWFYLIGLAIDRPDTFQLLFIVLSLTYIHRFWLVGQPSLWFCAVVFAALGFASKYSGHLLAPVLLLAWVVHWRKPEVRQAFAGPVSFWLTAGGLYLLSLALIFPLAFLLFSPYHLIHLNHVIEFFRTFLRVYQEGNVLNIPGLEKPHRLALWWGIFTSSYEFDWWMTTLGLVGAALSVIKNTVFRKTGSSAAVAGEWILLSWGTCYIGFLLYQYGLADYRYIMPAQFVLPFFFIRPVLWLKEIPWPALKRLAPIVSFGCLALVVSFCHARVNDTLEFLAIFRSEQYAPSSFAVGRYLDRMIEAEDNPKILMTNLAYIPPRFTDLHIRNVDVTCALIDKEKYDYILINDGMSSSYADHPTVGFEKKYDPLYKVYYVDVVEMYTKFKHKTHPDYRYVRSFSNYHLYERVDRTTATPFRLTNRPK